MDWIFTFNIPLPSYCAHILGKDGWIMSAVFGFG
jgi:hypothetical protein